MATVIAECCQNHNGDLGILKEMVWAAADAGADWVKIQSISANELTRRDRFEHGVIEGGEQKTIKRPYQPEYERLRPMDLDDDAHVWLIEECERAGVKSMTTVFSRAQIPFLASLPWKAIKVASYDCASFPMLRELIAHFEHLYISTGATHTREIEQAAELLAGHSYTFLHCVTVYPTPLDSLHLARMDFLRRFTPSVGFSDHSHVPRDGIKASLAALWLGADTVERHFTVLPPDQTRDGPVSINPEQLAELVRYAQMPREELGSQVREQIGDHRAMLGLADRPLSAAEELNRDYYRGRFASRVGDGFVFNWEESPVHV